MRTSVSCTCMELPDKAISECLAIDQVCNTGLIQTVEISRFGVATIHLLTATVA